MNFINPKCIFFQLVCKSSQGTTLLGGEWVTNKICSISYSEHGNIFLGLDSAEGSNHGFEKFHNIPHYGLLDDFGKNDTT
jgi:hypothetical protein